MLAVVTAQGHVVQEQERSIPGHSNVVTSSERQHPATAVGLILELGLLEAAHVLRSRPQPLASDGVGFRASQYM